MKRPFRNVVVPSVILVALITFMAGCIYVPWFPQHKGPQISNRAIHPGIYREQVHALLGVPGFMLPNGREGYSEVTSYGFWVAPLCFEVDPAFSQLHSIVFTYDKQGRLIDIWRRD